MKGTYLLIDLSVLAVPLAFSFHPRIRFDRLFRWFWPANLLVALLFIAWDALFTANGVWGFNERYLLGPSLLGLPLEEVLFFVCIPYACVFTFHCLSLVRGTALRPGVRRKVTVVLALLLSLAAAAWHDRAYTVITFSLLALTLLVLEFAAKASWLGLFYPAYGLLIVPFMIVNGLLTGFGLEAPVVWYDPGEQIGFRLLTIPVEDVFYGMLLVCSNLAAMQCLRRIFVPAGRLPYL